MSEYLGHRFERQCTEWLVSQGYEVAAKFIFSKHPLPDAARLKVASAAGYGCVDLEGMYSPLP